MSHAWYVTQKYKTPFMLPCPFCGGQATVRVDGNGKFSEQVEYPFGSFFSVGCGQAMSGIRPHCQIQPRTSGFLRPALAAATWNDRFDNDPARLSEV
jgi:hypothetical protein